jgi:DNA-binding NarL/FixJ family response regulator
MNQSRIAVFDDSADRRESLKYLIGMYPDLELTGAFEDCTDVLNKIRMSMPDVVLMDIEMPAISGIEATRIIKNAFPSIIVLMQTVYEDEECLFESLQAGASGYLLKKISPERLVDSIRDSLDGGAPMTPIMASKVLRYFKSNATENDYDLTPREKTILSLLVDGLSYKMIASKESISYHTVNAHVRKIYEKLHVKSLGEAVGKALREKLI